MDVVGDGFLAGHLRTRFHGDHPRVTAIAAGVSSTSVTDVSAFARETALVRRVLARSADRGHRVVLFSTASAAMYGADGCPGTEDDPVDPVSPYGAHKLGLEGEVRAAPARSTVLRVSHLVGPDQRPHHLLPALVGQILDGRVRLVRGAHRDLLDVDDLLTVVDHLVAPDAPDLLVNACTGNPQPVATVVDGIEARLGRRAVREVVDGGPLGAARIAADTTRLHALVPQVRGRDVGCLDRLLDRNLPAVAASLGRATARPGSGRPRPPETSSQGLRGGPEPGGRARSAPDRGTRPPPLHPPGGLAGGLHGHGSYGR